MRRSEELWDRDGLKTGRRRATLTGRVCARVCVYLWVVHVPHQTALHCVQDEVAAQELAAVLIFFYVQEATDAVLPIHVRHSWV